MPDKEEKMVRAAQGLLEKPRSTIREVAGFIGLTIAYSQAFEYRDKHTKQLEIEKVQTLNGAKGNFDAKMTLSERAVEDILWWVKNSSASGKMILRPKEDLVLYTDASNEGWGGHVGGRATGGRWSDSEKQEHINVLELKAIEFSLQSLCEVWDKHIKVFTDNMTAVAYVKHQGGVKSPACNEVAQAILAWCEEREIFLSIAHIPGIDNDLADFKSRHFSDNVKWSLND